MYGHALTLAQLDPCVDCSERAEHRDALGQPAWTTADDGSPVCARCALIREARAAVDQLDGLWVQLAPALPRGFQVKCEACGCSVSLGHDVNGDDCRLLQDERRWKHADE